MKISVVVPSWDVNIRSIFLLITAIGYLSVFLLTRKAFPFDHCLYDNIHLLSADIGSPTQDTSQREWTEFNQFILLQNTTSTTKQRNVPDEEDWLIDATPTAAYSTQIRNAIGNFSFTEPIPKQLFKVNINHDGHLQAIFQQNHNNDISNIIPQSLKQAHQSWKEKNPEYTIKYFDLNACRIYLHNHYHPIFLRAFDCLHAYAAKVDLFRYVIVYREGGWYSDWKEKCLVNNLLNDISKGNTTWWSAKDYGQPDVCQQTAFFGSKPQHPILADTIKRVLHNIQSKHYGENPLYPTGPCVFGQAINEIKNRHPDIALTMREGVYVWHQNASKEGFKYNNSFIVQHKCSDCGRGQSWENGNNYNDLWNMKTFYCPESSILFDTIV